MDSSTLVLTITQNDKIVHVGKRDVLLTHVLEFPLENPHEYYDENGQRYGVVSGALQAATGAPTDESRAMLMHRIDSILAKLQVALDRSPVAAEPGQRAPKQLPRVTGELPEVMQLLAAYGPTPLHSGPDLGSWWHQVAHKLGFAH